MPDKKKGPIVSVDAQGLISLPGEMLAVEIVKLIRETLADQPVGVKAQIWEWFIREMRRWRKFWRLDQDDELLREITEMATALAVVIASAEDEERVEVNLSVETVVEIVRLLRGDVVPPI
jgi:predicted alpha/beta hydrolase